LAYSHFGLFDDFREVPQRIARLYQDPLTNQEGSLTETRNYSSYARGMNEIIHLKYLDIRDGIKAGRIVDEGCADGALLAEISRDFPDSDLFGIDLSSEFAGRFHERQRAGEFGGAYVHFFHRNLFDRIFEPNSVDTTLCNSTLHEIWSYGEGEKSVRNYLAEKFRQLRPGGRLLISIGHPVTGCLEATGDGYRVTKKYYDESPEYYQFTGTPAAEGRWKGPYRPCVEFFHPTWRIVNAILAAGYQLLRMEEVCRLDDSGEHRADLPQDLYLLARKPGP